MQARTTSSSTHSQVALRFLGLLLLSGVGLRGVP